MNTKTLITLALALGTTGLGFAQGKADAVAPTAIAAPAVEAAPDFNFLEWLPERFAWFDAQRDNAENPYIQEFNVSFRAQWQMNWLDPSNDDRLKGDEGYNSEFRRFRLGANAKIFKNFKVKAVWNIGGLQDVAKYSNGDWNAGETSNSLDELCITGTFKPVSFTVGKHKADYLAEYATSSSKINTIERSGITNQLSADKQWGISIKNSDKKAKYGWQAGVWANGGLDNEWANPDWNSEASYMIGARVSMATGDMGRLTLGYMHSFAEVDASGAAKTTSKVGYEGPGAKDVISLSWQGKKDKVTLLADAIAGFNVIDGDEGAENVFGLVVIPTYRFSPHFEGVFRYQLSAGSNAAKCYKNYYTENSTYSSTADLLQGFYMGMNYYVDPKNTDHMRVMVGAEYLNSHGTNSKGQKGYTGWSFSTAFRVNF